MKIWKLISVLLLACMAGACDDDEKLPDDGNGVTEANVEVRFGYEAKTVLKNGGQVQVPIKLAKAVNNVVKVVVSAEQGDAETDAREGIDFNLPEKVIAIPAGDTLAYLAVDVLDNGKTDNDRVAKLNINGVFGGKLGTPSSTSLHIVSNAFVEFEKAKWETYESANVETSSEEIRNSRFVPLTITGELTEAATIVLEVRDGSAVEPTHFTVEKEVAVAPGTTKVNVEIKPVDDAEMNDDRVFVLRIKEIKGGGKLLIGKNNLECEVKIISEEVSRTVAFGVTQLSTKDIERSFIIPIFLDKLSVNDVKVTVGVSTLSTAVENEDYVIEDKTCVIGASLRGEIVVRILEDKIENPDRCLVLELKDATENVVLSQTAGTVTIDILNNDWDLQKKELNVVEDKGKMSLIVAGITPIEREREMKLEYVGNAEWFSELPEKVVIPAGTEEVSIDVNVGYALEWPADAPALEVKFVECDENVYDAPVVSRIEAEPCSFRKLTGSWTGTGRNNAGAVSVTHEATLSIVEWKKELVSEFTYSNSFKNTLYFAWNEDTEELSFIVGRRVYANGLNFGDALGVNVVLSEHGTQWGNVSNNVKVEYTDNNITVGLIGGVLWGADGTVRAAAGNAWWIWYNYTLSR